MNILLVRIGRLGDIVMILPALRSLIYHNPEAKIHAVTSPDGIRLLKTAGIPEANMVRYRHTLVHRLMDVRHVKHFLATHHFDKIYCFETKKRTVSWLPSDTYVLKNQQELEHYALRCLKLVEPGLSELHQNHYLTFKRDQTPSLNALLAEHNITPTTLLIGFHPTYSGYGKWGKKREQIHRLWCWKNFAKLSYLFADYAHQQKIDLKIIMDLLPEEQSLGLKIKQHGANNIVILNNKPDFNRYLCYINRLNLLIVPNTGVMHLAAALGTPMVALFSHLHPNDCGPYMPPHKFIVLRSENTLKPHLGLNAISVDDVFCNAIQLLNLKGSCLNDNPYHP